MQSELKNLYTENKALTALIAEYTMEQANLRLEITRLKQQLNNILQAQEEENAKHE